MARAWPAPRDADGLLHLIGDTHFGSVETTTNRKNLWAADARRVSALLPVPQMHVMVGDVTDHGLTAEDNEAVAFMNTVYGAGTWCAAVGNHDMYGTSGGPDRNIDVAAQAWGMPGGNYVRDLGWCRIVVLSPDGHIGDGFTMQPFTTTRLNWLNARLVEAGSTPCLIVCHWSLADTVQAAAGPQGTSVGANEPGYWATPDTDVETVLADNANAKAWFSGHTHSYIHAADLVTSVQVGGHRLVAINASSPAYVGAAENLSSPLYTLYAAVTDGRVDVRFRDHGAGVWGVAGPDRRQVWTASL